MGSWECTERAPPQLTYLGEAEELEVDCHGRGARVGKGEGPVIDAVELGREALAAGGGQPDGPRAARGVVVRAADGAGPVHKAGLD